MRNDLDTMLNRLLGNKYPDSSTYVKNTMTGGKKNEEYNEEILKKLKKLEKKVKEKGVTFWFDKSGKILVKEKKHNDGYNKMLKIIRKNMKTYDKMEIVSVDITFLPKEIGKKYKEDHELGVIEMSVNVHKIDIVDYDDKIVGLYQRNEKNSILTMYYREAEISDFKLQHIKLLANALITNKIKKTNMFKFYHLEDLEDILNVEK